MTKKKEISTKRGLTLIEIVVVVTVLVVLLTAIVIPFKQMNDKQALSKDTSSLISIINQARSQTLASKDGVQHGVHLEATQVVLFSGSTYVSSDPNNVIIPLHSLINISGMSLSGGATDIVFNRQTGTTAAFGTITLSLVASSTQAKVITINSTGIVDGNP